MTSVSSRQMDALFSVANSQPLSAEGAASASGSYRHCPTLPGPVLDLTKDLVVTATAREALTTLCPQARGLCPFAPPLRSQQGPTLRASRRGLMPRPVSPATR